MFPIIFDNKSSPLPDIPDELSGREGLLRKHDGLNLLQVDTDIEAINAWLNTTESEKTRRAYTREVERLLMWAYQVAGKPFSSLLRPDYEAYENFLKTPPASWCGPRAKRGTPEWRPLVGSMRPETARHSMIIIQSLLLHLVEQGYLAASPLAGKRKKRDVKQRNTKISLTRPEWDEVWKTIDCLPSKTQRERHRRERLWWTLQLLTYTGLRIEEAATHTMANFGTHIINDQRHWFLFVIGKGGKPAEIPLNNILLEALPRFRQSMGWDPDWPVDPSIEATRPLIPSQSGKPIGPRAIFQTIKNIFSLTAKRLEDEADQENITAREKTKNLEAIQHLKMAGPHTLRHTGITWLGDNADVKIQQVFARHSDIRTTISNYDHRHVHELIQAINNMKS